MSLFPPESQPTPGPLFDPEGLANPDEAGTRPKGWYADPDNRVLRYWDGSDWSDETRPLATPLPPPADGDTNTNPLNPLSWFRGRSVSDQG